MTICCEHNPCPDRPRWFLGKYQTQPWRCPQCGQFWCTKPKYLWMDFDGYEWFRVIPKPIEQETTND